MNLSISNLDALIVVAYMLATMAFGIWAGRGQKTTKDYFLAGRSLPWFAILFSIVATETSTVTFLSIPGQTFQEGGNFGFLQFALGLILGRVLVVLILLPGYFRGDLNTAYELLSNQFGKPVKWLASALFLVTRNLADGLRLFLTAIVLAKVTNLDMFVCIGTLGFVTIIYTMLGGMKSVVWNDCIQFFVYMAGGVWALYVLTQLIPGGWGGIMEFGQARDSFHVFTWRPNATAITVGSGVIGGAILCLGTHGADHMMVQRYLGAKSFRDAAFALITSGFVVFAQFSLFLFIGVSLACFFADSNASFSKDEVFASFIVKHLGVGVTGVTLAAVFSAAMSTLSSSLNASASAFVSDFYQELSPQTERDTGAHVMRISRISTIVFGLIQMGVAAVAVEVGVERGTVYAVLKIAGFTMGPILGLFLLANFVPTATSRGAFAGAFAGVVVLCVIEALVRAERLAIHPFYYTAIGAVITFLLGRLISLSGSRHD